MKTDLAKLRELVKKMTPGEWAVRDGQKSDELFLCDPRRGGRIARMWNGRRRRDADAAGICALRNAAPALLDELEQLRERVDTDRYRIAALVSCQIANERELRRADAEIGQLRTVVAAVERVEEELRTKEKVAPTLVEMVSYRTAADLLAAALKTEGGG